MKIKNIFFTALLGCSLCFLACTSDDWKDHYDNNESEIINDKIDIVEESSDVYLSKQTDLGKMYGFLKANGIFESLAEKGQMHTLLVVADGNFVEPESEKALFTANSHVTDIAISPSNLYDGERILMWHGKFVSVSVDSLSSSEDMSYIAFNEAPVEKVIKTSDGYIYVLSAMIQTPKSLYDFLDELGEEYSIFKDLVLAEREVTFDKANSNPIGVDNTGNTVYDSVFTYTNPFFDDKSFDLNSESLTATMLVFSNKVIEEAMAVADSTLAAWDMERDSTILRRWILKVSFFSERYSKATYLANEDLTSIYDCQWRTTVQEVDLDNPVAMSNGIAYYVTKLKIPNNVLMFRLKDFFYYYENCSDAQKTDYFVLENLVSKGCVTDVTEWTPLEGVWPTIINRVLECGYESTDIDGFTMFFTPIKRKVNEDGAYVITPWLVPPGEYMLCMGFKQNLNLDLNVSLLLKSDRTVLGTGSFNVGSATTYHYDRGNVNGYAEGYAEIVSELTHSKAKNYDRDGGTAIASVVVPDVKGDGSPSELVIKIENSALNGNTKMVFHHWCLRPLSNNY